MDLTSIGFPATGIATSVFGALIARLAEEEIAAVLGCGFVVRGSGRGGASEASPIETDPMGASGESRSAMSYVHPLARVPHSKAGALTVGRMPDADVSIPARGVSRIHARLIESADRRSYSIEDAAGSKNGTRVHGMTVKPGERLLLATGDPIELGSVSMLFVDHTAIAAVILQLTSESLVT